MSRYAWLPGLLAEIAGLEAALALAEAKGGTRAYFPAFAKPDHWLTQCVGYEAAVKICDHFRVGHASGYRELIPLGPATSLAKRRRMIARLTGEGVSADKIARQLGVHERSVRRARALKQDATGDLFAVSVK